MADPLRVRLLRDIAELQTKPYPNITLHVHDEDIEEVCLILTSEGYGPMHLTIEFPPDYPIAPPEIKMDSDVFHPNVEKSYICASILMTEEGYTPAYTLKGIAIQLLSFFSSDKIEQVGGQFSIDLAAFKETHSNQVFGPTHCCTTCGFGMGSIGATRVRKASVILSRTISEAPSSPQLSKISILDSTPATSVSGDDVSGTYRWEDMDRKIIPKLETVISLLDLDNDEPKPEEAFLEAMTSPASASILVSSVPARRSKGLQRSDLPDEVILVICEMLETEDLLLLGEAWDRVQFIMTEYDLLRIRQLQCFCFRTDFEESKLGVGVNATFSESRQGFFESEFDLLSEEGYHVYGIRRSVQGVEFEHWLPLPISEDHWEWVKYDVEETLWDMSINAKLGAVPAIQVIIHFMNDVMVKLNKQNEQPTIRQPFYPYEETPKSSLMHASEKAMESYFHLFHLLLCLATEDPTLVKVANKMLSDFAGGADSKDDCPNLGHLLVVALISDVEVTESILKSILKEAITRNSVWALKSYPELAYLEPSSVSHYRLFHTFAASRTSYRILMFLNLFRNAARGNHKPLSQLRDEAFARHGAPPANAASALLEKIKEIHTVDSFPAFLDKMGIAKPSGAWFTNFLRQCMRDSRSKGYLQMTLTQGQALALRLKREPGVDRARGVEPDENVNIKKLNFFQGKSSRGRGTR